MERKADLPYLLHKITFLPWKQARPQLSPTSTARPAPTPSPTPSPTHTFTEENATGKHPSETEQTRPEIPSQATSITCNFPAFAAINFTGAQQQQQPGGCLGCGSGIRATPSAATPNHSANHPATPPPVLPRSQRASRTPTNSVRHATSERSARGPAHMKVLARNIAAWLTSSMGQRHADDGTATACVLCSGVGVALSRTLYPEICPAAIRWGHGKWETLLPPQM